MNKRSEGMKRERLMLGKWVKPDPRRAYIAQREVVALAFLCDALCVGGNKRGPAKQDLERSIRHSAASKTLKASGFTTAVANAGE